MSSRNWKILKEFEEIRFEIFEGIAKITLNRPEKLNAYSPTMGEEIRDVLKVIDNNDDVRVVVITGAGRAFCAGGDIEGFDAAIQAELSPAKRVRDPAAAPEVVPGSGLKSRHRVRASCRFPGI